PLRHRGHVAPHREAGRVPGPHEEDDEAGRTGGDDRLPEAGAAGGPAPGHEDRARGPRPPAGDERLPAGQRRDLPALSVLPGVRRRALSGPPAEAPVPSPAAMMPARWVPLLYFAFAHACLATAFALLAFRTSSLAGFFYHPRMLAVVHLVTLGWISASILGAVYVIGPLAFRMPLPARRGDYAAFAGFSIGVTGMSSHFWIDSPRGTAWAAGLVAAAMTHVAARGLAGLRRAAVPAEARLPMALAFVNMIAAAGLGLLAAVHKV